jgi:hypothetical protein
MPRPRLCVTEHRKDCRHLTGHPLPFFQNRCFKADGVASNKRDTIHAEIGLYICNTLLPKYYKTAVIYLSSKIDLILLACLFNVD